MEIFHKIDVKAPASFIFKKLTDVASITENLPSNVVLRAEGDHSSFELGSKWVVRAQRTGRKFALNSEITKFDEDKSLGFSTASSRIESDSQIVLREKGKKATMIEFSSVFRPRGLLGRILIQSLKASRKRVDERLETSALKIKTYLEEAYDSKGD